MSSHANGMDEHNAITSPQMKHSMETGSHNGHDETAEHVMMFHLRTDLNLLFEPWNINSTKVLIGSCIGVLFVSFLYEGLKIYRAKLMHSRNRKKQRGANICSIHHWSQTIMHILQVVLGYLLMLVVMTYQVYLGVAVVVGAGLGYFIFAGLIGETDDEKPSSSPNRTIEMPAMILNVTNFKDFSNNQHTRPHKLSISDLAIENEGFYSETKFPLQ